MSKTSKENKILILKTTFVVFSLCLVLFIITYFLFLKGPSNITNPQDLSEYQEYYDQIVSTYDGEIDSQYMKESIISGIVQGLNDPHSKYIYSTEEQQYNDLLSSKFAGIGVSYVTNRDGSLQVVDVSEGGGSQKAGVYPGDIITEINGNTLDSSNSSQVVADITDNKTTTLKVNRPSEDKDLTFEITNTEIYKPTVTSEVIEHDSKKYGYIKITTFAQNSAKEFETELDSLESEGIDGLIIDVRDNGGGQLVAIEEILNSILSDERPYLYTKSDGQVVAQYQATKNNKKPYPIIALQNENSASASEILTSSLKEINQSEIVGTTSYGKGSVQNSIDYDDNSLGTLKITTEHWYTADDNLIDGVGITPTVEITEQDNTNLHPIVLEEKLQKGTYSDQNILVNNYLSFLGYDVNMESNGFDTKTYNAIISFQHEHNIEQTGIVDVITAQKLYDEASKNVHTYKNDLYISTAVNTFEK